MGDNNYSCVNINALNTHTTSYSSNDATPYRLLILGPNNVTCLIYAHCVVPLDSIKSEHLTDGVINDLRMFDSNCIFNKPNGIAGLDNQGRIKSEQLPLTAMNYLGTYTFSGTVTQCDVSNYTTNNYGHNITAADYLISNNEGYLDCANNKCRINPGDWIVRNGDNTRWDVVGNTSKVTSVNGCIGNVNLDETYYKKGFTVNSANNASNAYCLGGCCASCYYKKSDTVTNATSATLISCNYICFGSNCIWIS